MPDSASTWNTPALWEQLNPLLPGLSVEVVAQSVSTNTDILERVRLMRPEADTGPGPLVRRSVESAAFGRRTSDVQPCLLVAQHQTGGRGRQGRQWQSADGASLTFSLALPLRLSDWSGLSLAVGVALAEALDPPAAATASGTSPTSRIGLKWPNDLWLMDGPGAGRKLGGILIETVSVGAHRIAVIGIGLNIRALNVGEAGTGFACVNELDAEASPQTVLHQVALPLVNALRLFERQGFAAFAQRYAARDLLLGRAVNTTQPDAPEGVADGISEHGALRLLRPSGLVLVSSGEVSVRLGGTPPGGTGTGTGALPC
jgi:BirA family transcriptional regulator, biotin operon repressor / biotin---[acetyl-CoA-carboxylase] ligase